MPVFSLEEARALQVKNISQNTSKYWSESAVYGYYVGGYFPPSAPPPPYPPSGVSLISRLDFSNETVSNPGKNLSTGRGYLSAVSNNSYGYFGGGGVDVYLGPSTIYNTISRLDFSNETVSDPGKNLPTTISSLTATSSSSYGYFVGGALVSTISRLDFSNENVSNPGKTLPFARSSIGAVSNNSYGYFAGGFYTPVPSYYSCVISRLDFSSETTSDPGKNLSQITNNYTATSSNSYGYFVGGYSFPPLPPASQTPTSGVLSTITRLDFSNETVSNPGKNLPQVTQASTATSSSSYGYFGGGSVASLVNTISRLDFSNETVSASGKNLPTARQNLAAVSGGASVYRGSKTYGYIGGGVSPPPFTYFSEVLSRDFSNDSNATIGSFSTVGLIPGGRWGQATLSSNYYGYFCGGQMPPGWSPGYFNTVTRIDFSNNTVTDPGRNFITDFRYAAGSSSNSYGFIVGGFRGVTMCSIQRMDFSSETFASTGQPNVFFTGSQASVSNNSYGYHVDSGTTYRLDFSTSGLSLPGNNTNLQVRTNIAGFSNNRYGYFGGGYSPTSPGTYTSQMARLDFSTESYSSSTNLPVATSLHAGTSSNTHGYFIAGANPPGVTRTTAVNKLDFGTEIFSPTTAIPSARSELSAMSNSN